MEKIILDNMTEGCKDKFKDSPKKGVILFGCERRNQAVRKAKKLANEGGVLDYSLYEIDRQSNSDGAIRVFIQYPYAFCIVADNLGIT